MTRESFVSELITQAKSQWSDFWSALPDETRLRLAGLEAEIEAMGRAVVDALWGLASESLALLAAEQAGCCACGRRRERREGSVALDVLGRRVELACPYFYCRVCRSGVSPVRQWLGLESGGVSMGLERALVELTTRMTFGNATQSLAEHHGQDIDRTKAERVTYAVAREAEEYMVERRRAAKDELRSGEREGPSQLVFTADGGAVPVGSLSRSQSASSERTPVRKLARGRRAIAGREARFISVHEAGVTHGRAVDCHIAPYDKPDFTGARMLATAALAGLSDKTRIHGVFDMGTWIHTQFEEQFASYEHTACADIMHVTQYLIDAGRVLVGEGAATAWGMAQKHAMLAGQYAAVLDRLSGHACAGGCQTNEHGTCLMRCAERYLTNNRVYMDRYDDFMVANLPVGSGEAESGIRHIIKRRMAVAGAWREDHAALMLALLTVRACGFWDDFWRWRNERDKHTWHRRQENPNRPLMRNKRPSKRAAPMAA